MTETVELREMRILIPGFVPNSGLGINGRNGVHWSKVRQLKIAAKNAVSKQLMIDGWPGQHWRLPRAQVTVTFVFPNRRKRDVDNLAGRVKPLLDALVDAGILIDDNAERVDLVIRCRAQAGTTETVIHIRELDADDDWTQGPLL